MTIKQFSEAVTLPHDFEDPGCFQEQLKRKAVRARGEKGIEAAIREAYGHYQLKDVEGDIKKVK